MKILVIPDVHLKPWMFDAAAKLLRDGVADQAVCLMDLADDWGKQFQIELYAETYHAAIDFAEAFPDTLWCYGNHDVSYPWQQKESGYSSYAPRTVCECLHDLEAVTGDRLAFIHRVDDVLFMHGGLSEEFVRRCTSSRDYNDIDKLIAEINDFGPGEMWWDYSPIWFRPQYTKAALYKPEKYLQVVGHTPMHEITISGNLISCDVFSSYRDGKPAGTHEFTLIDTESWAYKGIPTEWKTR